MLKLRQIRPTRWLAGCVLLATLVLVSGAALGTAEAAFPGSNGKIAFMSDRDGNLEIYVMNADGTGQTNLTNNAAEDLEPAWSPDGSKIAFTSRRSGNYDVYVMNADGSNPVNLTNDSAYDAEAAWSPDGSKIAFTSLRSGNYETYAMNADGSGVTNLTNNPALERFPAWSPTGTMIAFMRPRDGNDEVYVMNADGSGQANVTNDAAQDWLPSWSPDGTKLSFASYRDGNYEVYVTDAGGGGLVNRTNNPDNDYYSAWSPDGSKIAFNSGPVVNGNYEIFVMNADGSGRTNLTNNSAGDYDPDWQPLPPQGGGKIAFKTIRDGQQDEIYTMDANGANQLRVTNTPAASADDPAWSPDGTKIAFVTNGGIAVMNADGSGQLILTNTFDAEPAWSPDGTRIVFISHRDGNYEVYVMNADGSGQTNLTNNPADDVDPAWSPNGARVAFASNRSGHPDVWVMNVDGSNPENLTRTGFDEQPAWSPDAKKISFASSRDGNYEIYVMNADGSGQTRLTTNPRNDARPAWSPDGGKIAFDSVRDDNFEIYVMNADGSGQTRLTSNSVWDTSPDWQPTGVQGLGHDLFDPNVRLADNFYPPDVGNQLVVADGDAACAPNSALNQPSTIHVVRTTPFPGGPGGGGSAVIPGASQGGWAFGSITWDLDVTIGAQTNPAVGSFWPLNDNGAPMDSGGLKTGAIQSITGNFTIDPGNDGVGIIRGTVSGGPNAANWGVCRKFNDEPTESPTQGFRVTGSFYMINAGALTYHVRIGPPDFFGETGDATAYFMNSLSTARDCPNCGPRPGAQAGHFRMEFGTTVLGGGVTQMSAGGENEPVTVEPIPDVTIRFPDVRTDGATNVVKTTDAPPLPGGFHLAEGFFYEIFTTATYATPITICLPLAGLPAGSTPQILHYETPPGGWVSVATTVNGAQACGQVNSLSPVAIGYTPLTSPTPRGTKRNVLTEMQARAQQPLDPGTKKKINEGIRHLTNSIDSPAWVDDSHLATKGFDPVFDEESAAVDQIEDIKPASGITATVEGWMQRLATADRLLAATACADGWCSGARSRDLAKYNDQLAKGDAEFNKGSGYYDNAIDHYKNAWKAIKP
jgi:Tol biopolymer transport system component